MRITENMRYASVQRSLQALRSRHATVSEQVSTGRRVLAPSTDPIAAAELTRVAGKLARTGDLREGVAAARDDLNLAERSLAASSSLLVRAKELAIQGANGTLSGPDREGIAQEVISLRDNLLGLANTQGSSGSLFAGSQIDKKAFDQDGQYLGDAQRHSIAVAPGVLTAVHVTGAEAFTAAGGGTDAFAALAQLRDALLTNDRQAVAASLTELDGAREQIVRTQAETGLILNRLDSADVALEATELELMRVESERGGVDSLSALSELSQLSTSLEQSIGVARLLLNTEAKRF